MARKNIGATLSLRDGGFTSGIKNAITGFNSLKSSATNATGSIKKAGSYASNAASGLTDLAKKAVGVVAAYAGFVQAKDFIMGCVTAANESANANARLDQLMGNVKGTTVAQIDAVKSYASELQKLTVVEDDVTIAGASQLSTFALNGNSIKKLLPAMNDLAVGTYGVNVSQEQIIGSANLMGKVMQGQVGALSRVGVTFSKTQEDILKNGTEAQKTSTLIEVLKQNYGGLAEKMAQTPAGRIIQLKNAWGDVQETIGGELYPVITTVLGFMADKIPVASSILIGAINAVKPPLLWIKDNILPPLTSAFMSVWNWGVSAFNNIKAAVEANMPKFESIKAVAIDIGIKLLNAFEAAKPAINWLKDIALPLVVVVLGDVIKSVTDVYNFISNNWGAIAPVVGGVAAAFAAYQVAVGIATLITYIHTTATAFATGATLAFGAALAFVTSPIGLIVIGIGLLIAIGIALWMNWDNVCKWIAGAWTWVSQTAVTVWGGICDFFVAYWPWILGIFTGGIGLVVGLVIQNWDSIKTNTISVFNTVKDTVLNIWGGIVSGIKGFVNMIIGAINGMVRGINGIAFDVPSWVPVIGGKQWGFAIPEIPMLASGGIIQKSGSVMVGEKGAEILNLPRGASVTPLDKSGSKTENHINININGTNFTVDEIIGELVPRLKLAIANL